MSSDIPIPSMLARQIRASLEVSNNLAFDLVRGKIHGTSRTPPEEPRYTSRVREGFSRAYKLAVDFNHSSLDLDHLLAGFLNTPECDDYFTEIGLDKKTTYEACMGRLTARLELGRILTAEFLPMTDVVSEWHSAGLEQTKRRDLQNRALDVGDLFDAVLPPLDVSETKLGVVQSKIKLVNPNSRPTPLRELLKSIDTKIESKTKEILGAMGVDARSVENGETLNQKVQRVHADVVDTRGKVLWAHDESMAAHDMTHAKIDIIDVRTANIYNTTIKMDATVDNIDKTADRIDATTTRIEEYVAPMSASVIASVLAFAAVLGVVGGWLARQGELL